MKKFKLLAAIALCLLAGCGEKNETAEKFEMSVNFLKVGKADAAVIKTKEHIVVIDCGETSDGGKVTDCLKELGAEKIDYMILTHYDQDHIGGATKVVKKYDTDHIISPNYKEGSKEFDKLCNAMDKKEIEFEKLKKEMTFTLDDAEFTVFPCRQNIYNDNNDNNHSLVVKIAHHDKVFLFMGDAMEDRLNEVMEIGDCDVMKEPYHGREIANIGEFLDKTTPEYAIISTDKGGLSDKLEKEFTDRGIQTYVTFREGNIRCTSDGENIRFN